MNIFTQSGSQLADVFPETKLIKFGPINYERVGQVSLLALSGMTIYMQVGFRKSLLGLKWGKN